MQVSGLSPGLPQRSREAEAAAYIMAMGIIAGSGGRLRTAPGAVMLVTASVL